MPWQKIEELLQRIADCPNCIAHTALMAEFAKVVGKLKNRSSEIHDDLLKKQDSLFTQTDTRFNTMSIWNTDVLLKIEQIADRMVGIEHNNAEILRTLEEMTENKP